MGAAGLELIESELPKLRQKRKIDFVIAQAENVSNGRGCTIGDFDRLMAAGVDFCTGGNWTLHQKDIYPYLEDPSKPIVRPANYPQSTPGLGYKYVKTTFGKILIISVLGQTVGRDSNLSLNNPLKTIDSILEKEEHAAKAATIINFHGDYSSEKVVIGHYLNGRATAVIGDHWHVPTADARILDKGTAHVSDVGMVGALNASLGVRTDVIIERWRDGKTSPNVLDSNRPWQFNALFFEVDPRTAKAIHCEHIHLVYE